MFLLHSYSIPPRLVYDNEMQDNRGGKKIIEVKKNALGFASCMQRLFFLLEKNTFLIKRIIQRILCSLKISD